MIVETQVIMPQQELIGLEKSNRLHSLKTSFTRLCIPLGMRGHRKTSLMLMI